MTEPTDTETEWLAWRTRGVGASDVAAAHTGLYGGIYGVVADKLGHTDPDPIDPELAARGKRWEQPVADAVHVLTGYYVHGEQMWIEHPDNSVWRCTLDGLLDPRPELNGIDDAEALLEVKTIGLHVRWKMDYWEAQCQWQMHVTGKQRAMLAVARIDDTDDTCKGVPHLDWIEYDPYLAGTLVDTAKDIWAHVERGELPEPDEHTDDALVKEINREADDDTGNPDPSIDLGELDDHLDRYLVVKAALSPLMDERKELERLFRHTMGRSVLAESDRHRLRVGTPVEKFTSDSEDDALAIYPDYGRTVLDRARFKAEEPDLYKAFRRPTTDRRITVKELNQ